jgi:flagellar biosynthesis/type III secretory pathway M-ring protein FliF/YscJ
MIKQFILKHRVYFIFTAIIIIIIAFFLFRESELKRELNNQRQHYRNQLIQERNKLEQEIKEVEQNAQRTIDFYRDKNEQRKEKLNKEHAKITPPATTDDILNILKGAKRKL